MGDSMTRYIVVSVVLHVLASGGVAGFAAMRPKPAPPTIFKTHIVSLPGPKGGPAAVPAPEPAKPAPTPPAPAKETPKPKPPPKEQVKKSKETKATKPVPTKKRIVDEKPKEEPKAPPDRRTGGFKGKTVETPAAPATQLPGGGSASIGVDATDFTFSYYLVTVQDKIAREWDPPTGIEDGRRVAVIYFQIERDGRIVRPEVETSSGVPLFDETARRAVERAILPPLPTEFSEERLGVHFQFEYAP